LLVASPLPVGTGPWISSHLALPPGAGRLHV